MNKQHPPLIKERWEALVRRYHLLKIALKQEVADPNMVEQLLKIENELTINEN